nr:Ger(x)C family spore germination C-terminal domain-containing protein [Bacillus thuringiensis]
MLESAQTSVRGQLRAVLFTKLARNNILIAYDTIIRDVNVGHTIYVGVLDRKPYFKILVKMEAHLQEVENEINLEKGRNLKKITRSIEEQLDTESEKLITKMQNLNIDPLGLGAKFRRHREFKLQEWNDIYQTVSVDVQYKVSIENWRNTD